MARTQGIGPLSKDLAINASITRPDASAPPASIMICAKSINTAFMSALDFRSHWAIMAIVYEPVYDSRAGDARIIKNS